MAKNRSYETPRYASFSDLLPLHLSGSKYSPQHPLLKHPQSMPGPNIRDQVLQPFALSGPLVTTVWLVCRLLIEETASKYGGWLQLY
jgi:hypothetical protein